MKNVRYFLYLIVVIQGTILDLRYKYINKNKKRIENKKANLICPTYMISGCKDFQTSADYFDHEMDQYGGAFN